MRSVLALLVAASLLALNVAGGERCCVSPVTGEAAGCCDTDVCAPPAGHDDGDAGEAFHLHPCVCASHGAMPAEAAELPEMSSRGSYAAAEVRLVRSEPVAGVFHVPLT